MANLYTADEWKGCLCDVVRGASAKPIFVVGAGLSWDGKVGVWGVAEIVEYVKTTFKDIPGIAAVSGVGSGAHQDILDKLKGSRRQTAVDKAIRHAILAAAKEGDAKARAKSEVDSNSELKACIALQGEPSAWNLPAGVGALADLIGLMEARAESTPGWQHPCVLSTNFDGLLEIALHQRGIKHRSEVIAGDQFPQGIAGQVSILHLHGYWLRAPTLHDPAALKAERPSLEAIAWPLVVGL